MANGEQSIPYGEQGGMDMADTVSLGLLIRFEALSRREADVESFLRSGLPMVQEEPKTTTWFGIQPGGRGHGARRRCLRLPSKASHRTVGGRLGAAVKSDSGE
jgi:hypothetical protein